MIKNIVFDIGNVILKFDINDVLNRYTSDKEEQEFILDNIINSPEWLKYGLIDTGNKLGIISKKVEPDNCQNVIDLVNEMNLI